ncbi:hypothetical protein AX16_006829 [Volvariella volvacea WC 439]|nr:hypothetical protein AX16_006829 [Volvariella volvacea WC 439]
MSSTSSPQPDAPTSAPETTVSPRFAADDADIILQSIDNVQFRLHRINLRMHSDIFADAEAISTNDQLSASANSSQPPEVVHLSEHSSVLELLFQYMYRQPPPDLSPSTEGGPGVAFEVLAGLAEAAEKYRVYYAIDGCKRAMREAISEHPFEVMKWAIKHKHTKIIDQSAEAALALHNASPKTILEPGLYLAWTEYILSWHTLLSREATRYRPTASHWNNATRETDIACEPWTHSYALIMHRFGGKPEMLFRLQSVFAESEDYLRVRCPECADTVGLWKREVGREVEKAKKFSEFV